MNAKERDVWGVQLFVFECCVRLVEAEVDLDIDLDRNRGLSVAHGWLEFVLAHGFHGFFVQTHTKGADDVDVLWIALRVDNKADEADTLILGAARFIRELCVGLEQWNWRGNAAANLG